MPGAVERLNTALEGRYRIERELGIGGMATVYLAEDLKHDRNVAIKVLKPELAAVLGAERFVQEIRTTAQLQHPHILPLFDSGEADGFLFYVMPFVEGESLRDRLARDKQLPVDEAVRIAVEVAEALGVAHEHGVVHRDIKPANIMVSKGRPLVADFGIAIALSSAGGHRLTETGLSLGTPHYMSPEQATGDQAVGPQSDIYSLGCVLYEMLVGEPPYTGSTAQAILGRVITGEPASVTSQRRAVPLHVDAVLSRALEKLPADRFASAEAFARALGDEGFRHGVGAVASAAASRRTRALAIAGWTAAVVLGGLWLSTAFEADAPSPVRVMSLSYLPETGPSEWLALTPDGSALVMADRARGTGQRFNLIIQRLDDLSRQTIPNSSAGFDPVVSRDGREVAFGGEGGIHIAPLGGGSTRTLAELPASACCIRWGDDGFVYFQQNPTGIYRIRTAGGEPELILEAEQGESLAYYRPISEDLAIVHAHSNVAEMHDRIEAVRRTTGERHLVTEGKRPFVTRDGYLVFARDASIFAARIDPQSLELMGDPVRMVDGVGTSETDAMFALSEGGHLVYWISYGGAARQVRELVWVDRRGQTEQVDESFAEQIESVELSPDGTRVAVTLGSLGRTEIRVKSLVDGQARRLTSQQGLNRRPVWSPDGERLAFISDRGGPRAVYVVSVDAIDTPRLLLEHRGEDVDEVDWSPDGDWMIYRTGTATGNRDIFARRLSPDTATIVVSAMPDIDERSPVLSPNGRWVAYVSDQTGQDEVWVRPFPDSERGSRQVSVDLGLEPFWSPDGAQLLFRARAGVTSVPVGAGLDFSSGALETLFPNQVSMMNTAHRSYGYDADRDRFLTIRRVREEEVPGELILVQNFMNEVRARVGN